MGERTTLAIAITIVSAHCSWILMSGAALVRWLDVPIRLVGPHHRGGNNRHMSVSRMPPEESGHAVPGCWNHFDAGETR